ncbi:hypothetical protein FISHEDRAFT_56194 [Fistulina hepatica ATCC 64428]|uniref:Uncharacterized protein n=1 Tax=Fistulina hepatica ATCC 64428 TaxID=1128425 RepID=A0A0D7AKW4_9AGAR|nr:hypothetical protein FISHEDRAFT_56194 [Fistulina hepatica ATCC 64428]
MPSLQLVGKSGAKGSGPTKHLLLAAEIAVALSRAEIVQARDQRWLESVAFERPRVWRRKGAGAGQLPKGGPRKWTPTVDRSDGTASGYYLDLSVELACLTPIEPSSKLCWLVAGKEFFSHFKGNVYVLSHNPTTKTWSGGAVFREKECAAVELDNKGRETGEVERHGSEGFWEVGEVGRATVCGEPEVDSQCGESFGADGNLFRGVWPHVGRTHRTVEVLKAVHCVIATFNGDDAVFVNHGSSPPYGTRRDNYALNDRTASKKVAVTSSGLVLPVQTFMCRFASATVPYARGGRQKQCEVICWGNLAVGVWGDGRACTMDLCRRTLRARDSLGLQLFMTLRRTLLCYFNNPR